MLRDLQLNMQRHVTRAETAVGDPGAAYPFIADAPPLPSGDRIAIYQNAYRSRLIDAVADSHPILVKILGDDDFAAAATLFIDSLPSTHRSIRWYGREFADSLQRRAPFDQQPILAEVARFEWSLAEAFDAPDAPSVERATLHRVAAERWADLRLTMHPSLRRIELQWNTVAAWQAMSKDESPPPPQVAQSVETWLIWRQDLKSNFRSLDAAERTALDAAIRGDRFAQVCVALVPFATEAEIPLRAATYIAGWIDSSLISRVYVDDGTLT